MIIILVVWFILVILGICLLKVGSGEPLSPPRKLQVDGTKGYCTHCGNFQDGVAPEARSFYCEACNNYTLFGVGELLALRQVQVLDLVKKEGRKTSASRFSSLHRRSSRS